MTKIGIFKLLSSAAGALVVGGVTVLAVQSGYFQPHGKATKKSPLLSVFSGSGITNQHLVSDDVTIDPSGFNLGNLASLPDFSQLEGVINSIGAGGGVHPGSVPAGLPNINTDLGTHPGDVGGGTIDSGNTAQQSISASECVADGLTTCQSKDELTEEGKIVDPVTIADSTNGDDQQGLLEVTTDPVDVSVDPDLDISTQTNNDGLSNTDDGVESVVEDPEVTVLFGDLDDPDTETLTLFAAVVDDEFGS